MIKILDVKMLTIENIKMKKYFSEGLRSKLVLVKNAIPWAHVISDLKGAEIVT